MRARVGVPLAIMGFTIYMFAMITANKYIGVVEMSAKAQPVVAGVSTEKPSVYVPIKSQSITRLVNGLRSEGQAGELVEDERLNAVALERAMDMRAQRYYAHRSPAGRTFVDLFAQYTIPATTYSCENLLMTTSSSEQDALNEWMASPPHKDCMLDPQMTRVGFAAVEFDSVTGQQLFVAIFANGI